MITFKLNGIPQSFEGDEEESLLTYLRTEKYITSVKDGCSGEGTCGACSVEINGKAKLSCQTKMRNLQHAEINTLEGLPEHFKTVITQSFAQFGAVQCGFCTPGMIIRAKALYNTNHYPTEQDIIKAINPNICRCTGYIKIVEAIKQAFDVLNGKQAIKSGENAAIGSRFPKYKAIEAALGKKLFVDDIHFEGLLHAALKFSEHPRAIINSIDLTDAENLEGVIKIFTSKDITGNRFSGLIFKDWPLMIAEGETTRYMGDVIAGVVAINEKTARLACERIKINYTELPPISDMHQALKAESAWVHPNQSNILETCAIQHGDISKAFDNAAYTSSGIYETQRIEHAFLETEAAIAIPEKDGLRIYSQGQGVYVDRKQIASILQLDEQQITIIQVENGGGFGGKEDLTVQGHVALFSYLLKQPVKLKLSRAESLIMHPKRHPVWMNIALACDKEGKFTALTLEAVGDTGAYASVGTKVMERFVGHATGAYTIPAVDIKATTVYTNNVPCGAMRGFGVPQVVFAIESCIDDICRQGSFDRWQIRYDNALENGSKTATGQRLYGVGLKKTLLAVKQQYNNAKYAGIACAIKNTGVGNGMNDESDVKIKIVSDNRIEIHHGWTEMGQGIHTMAIQTLYQECKIEPSIVEVIVDTSEGLTTGMTTSSRATALMANALINAAKALNDDLKQANLSQLKGRVYRGKFVCDWTSKPDSKNEDPVIHFAYGYATQVVILDDKGKIERVIAAHDAGKIMNRMLFEGQIEGAVHMGLGYALSEDFPMEKSRPVSLKYKDLGIIRANEMPKVEIIGIEETDPIGPYGAKGIGEIGLCPTAAAVANAFCIFDGKKRNKLPLNFSSDS